MTKDENSFVPENSVCGMPLERLFNPRSIALVGASRDVEKIAGRPLRFLVKHTYQGKIFPVNPKYDYLEGLRCFPSVASLPETPEVAMLMLRAPQVPQALEECANKGVPYGVIISGGFREVGQEDLHQEVLAIAQRGNMRLLGPNCHGFASFHSGTCLSFSTSLQDRRVEPGGIAFISQSGAFGFSAFAMAVERGVRFHSVITTGNQMDLDVVDVGFSLLEDPRVSALFFYLEGLRPHEGDRFVSMVERAHEKKIPLGILKSGNTKSAQEAVQSHTAVFTGESAVWQSVFRQYGVIPLKDARDMADLALLIETSRPLKGKRVGICTTSGGAGIVATDCCVSQDLSVPPLSQRLQSILAKHIPFYGSPKNPVDITAQITEAPEGYLNSLKAMVESGEIDMLFVVYSMLPPHIAQKLTENLIALWKETSLPLGCCWLADESHSGKERQIMQREGLPFFRSLEDMARAFGALVKWKNLEEPFTRKTPLLPSKLETLQVVPTEYEAKKILKHYDISVTREYLCTSMREAMDAAESLGWPVALKAMSPQIPHKSDAGGVILNIRMEEQLRNAYGRILERVRRFSPEAEIRGILVQKMVSPGMECMVGMRRDPLFGPIILLGLGGIYVETLSDVALRRAPISAATAGEMICQLQGYPLLLGERGESSRDLDALEDLLVKVSAMALSELSLEELDCNPVFLFPQGEGLMVVDAFMRRRDGK